MVSDQQSAISDQPSSDSAAARSLAGHPLAVIRSLVEALNRGDLELAGLPENAHAQRREICKVLDGLAYQLTHDVARLRVLFAHKYPALGK